MIDEDGTETEENVTLDQLEAQNASMNGCSRSKMKMPGMYEKLGKRLGGIFQTAMEEIVESAVCKVMNPRTYDNVSHVHPVYEKDCSIKTQLPSTERFMMSSQNEGLSNTDDKIINEISQYVRGRSEAKTSFVKDNDTGMNKDVNQEAATGRDNRNLKEKILVRNQIQALGQLMEKSCQNEQDVRSISETLFSIDRKFADGIGKDLDSFFNSLGFIIGNQQTAGVWRQEIALYISENARTKIMVSIYLPPIFTASLLIRWARSHPFPHFDNNGMRIEDQAGAW